MMRAINALVLQLLSFMAILLNLSSALSLPRLLTGPADPPSTCVNCQSDQCAFRACVRGTCVESYRNGDRCAFAGAAAAANDTPNPTTTKPDERQLQNPNGNTLRPNWFTATYTIPKFGISPGSGTGVCLNGNCEPFQICGNNCGICVKNCGPGPGTNFRDVLCYFENSNNICVGSVGDVTVINDTQAGPCSVLQPGAGLVCCGLKGEASCRS